MKIILKYLSKIIIWIIGWKIVGTYPNVPKMIIVLAPHRKGLFEVIMGLLVSYACGMKGRSVLVKEEAFKNPIVRWFLKKIGAIETRRNASMKNGHVSQVQHVVDEINAAEYVALVITPEGTRIKKENPFPEWKSGFYFIASEANIPYVLVAWDYDNKSVVFNDAGATYVSKNTGFSYIDDIHAIFLWYRETVPGYSPNMKASKFNKLNLVKK